jgi:hypothetical protein
VAICADGSERGLGSTRVLACDWPASPPANGSHIDNIAAAVLTMLVARVCVSVRRVLGEYAEHATRGACAVFPAWA